MITSPVSGVAEKFASSNVEPIPAVACGAPLYNAVSQRSGMPELIEEIQV
jgi:hypothetical protein